MGKNYIQSVFQRHGKEFREAHNLSAVQLKAMHAIESCSTHHAGSHSFACNQCGHTEVAYNSCQNRHCPHCQWFKQEIWMDKVKSTLLPVKYVHLVFTLPEFLNEFVSINHQLIYSFLFEASWHAVNKCAVSRLGIETGALSVLHTWGQNLSLHPHIHMLVPAGGLDTDHMQWIESPEKFFLPVRALSKIFRARVLFLLLGAVFDKSLKIPEKWNNINVAEELRKKTNEKDWVVHSEKSRLNPVKVIKYLGKYIQRVAISNRRIESAEGGNVCFSCKDYRDKGKRKKMILKPIEFIRRFLLHVLPQRFCKVRYYGILSIKNRNTKLTLCYDLINKAQLPPRFNGLNVIQILMLLTGKDFSLCPCCNSGQMQMQMKRFKPPE
ncbi:MAG: IS91 family transposase [Tannerella sp.]|jgi:hypothetical protein|nr:IS91 family transposase [Tannerella sp.]